LLREERNSSGRWEGWSRRGFSNSKAGSDDSNLSSLYAGNSRSAASQAPVQANRSHPARSGYSWPVSPPRKRLVHPGRRIDQRGWLSQAAEVRLSRDATSNHESNSFIDASYELSSPASLPTEDAWPCHWLIQDVLSSATAYIHQPLLQSEHPYQAV